MAKKEIKKLNCDICKQKCCEGQLHIRGLKEYLGVILLPLNMNYIEIDGIKLKRITDRKWRCIYFSEKTKKCENYKNRPTICKNWYCQEHIDLEKIKPTLNTSILGLYFRNIQKRF